jgi:guanylate kinase
MGSVPGTQEVRMRFRFASAGFLTVVSGPSGAGKGTLVQRLVSARPECVLSVSTTTRPRRPGELEGVQYHFVTPEEFERRRAAGLFLESAEVHGHLYATPLAFVDEQLGKGKVVVLEVDVQGAEAVRRARPSAVSVFIHPPSIDALRTRLSKRGTDPPQVVERRLQKAPDELLQYRDYDYMVVNDELEQAVARLTAIVDAERARVRRLIPAP